MSRLDRSRSYGTVMGGGHSFEQDGKCFNAAGEEIRSGSKAAAPEPIAATVVVTSIATPAGPVILDGMEAEQLHALAKDLGLKLNVNLGAKKVTAALLEAFPPKPAEPDQVDQQLGQ